MPHLEAKKSPLVFVMLASSIAVPAMCQTEAKPASQTATVYVYRIKVRLVARALRALIYSDGNALWQPCPGKPVMPAAPTTPMCVIRLSAGEYLSYELSAGKHTISATLSEGRQLFNVEPSREYFFKLDHNNILTHREPMTLTLVPIEQARREMEGLRKR